MIVELLLLATVPGTSPTLESSICCLRGSIVQQNRELRAEFRKELRVWTIHLEEY